MKPQYFEVDMGKDKTKTPVKMGYNNELYAFGIHNITREKMEARGWKLTPLVALTPDVVEALNMLVDLAQYDLDEGYRRDKALQEAVEKVRALLEQAGGE